MGRKKKNMEENIINRREGRIWIYLLICIFKPPVFGDIQVAPDTIMNKYEDHIEFDNIFSTKDGYIARHVMKNDPSNFLLNFRWWISGNVRISIPINTYNIENAQHLNEYNFLNNFIYIAKEKGFSEIKIADFTYFLNILLQIIDRYINLNEKIVNDTSICARIVLNNTLGISPFINDELCLNNSNKYGIPVVEDSDIYIPERVDFLNFIEFESFIETVKYLEFENLSSFDVRSFPITIKIFYHILHAVGLLCDIGELVNYKLFFKEKKV